MAFTPIDIPIEEILITSFITDISQINNANALQLKSSIEDLVNGFEMDSASKSIGNINNLTVVNTIFDGGGFSLRTGVANTVISKLEITSGDKSKFTVDYLNVPNTITAGSITSAALDISNIANLTNATLSAVTTFTGALVESKQSVMIDVDTVVSSDGIGVLNLTSATAKNIYLKLKCYNTVGGDTIFDNTTGFGVNRIILRIEFDAANPPAPNQVFKIFIADVLNSAEESIIVGANPGINDSGVDIVLEAGLNNSSGNEILFHSGRDGLTDQGNEFKVEADYVLYEYGANVSLNYIVDDLTIDRLIITSKEGFDFF